MSYSLAAGGLYSDPDGYEAAGSASASGFGWSTAFAGIGLGLSILGGIASTNAAKKSARAEMRALENERRWNLGVMEQNLVDTRERSLLSSYESGIDPMTGSNFAVIEGNERVLRDEMNFTNRQYLTKLGNARAQSKQKYLGIF